jgi:hypothetical protein
MKKLNPMNYIRITVFMAVLLPALGGCHHKPVPPVSEYLGRIQRTYGRAPIEQRLLIIDSAVTAYPDEAAFYFERGICQFVLRNDSGAISDLSQAILLARDKDCETYRNALDMRGFKLMRKGKHLAAFDDFWEAASPGSKCEEPAHNRMTHYWSAAIVARRQFRFDLVDSVFQQWKLIDSTYSDLQQSYAETYLLKEMPNEALAAYNTVLQDSMCRNDYNVWLGRAKTFLALEKDKDAQQDLATAQALLDGDILRIGDSLSFSVALAEILLLKGEYASTIRICTRFIKDGDALTRSMLICTRGDAMQATGNPEQACDDWEKSAALGWVEADQRLAQFCKQ